MIMMIQILHERRYSVKDTTEFIITFYSDICLIPFNVFFVFATLLGSSSNTREKSKNMVEFYLQMVDEELLDSSFSSEKLIFNKMKRNRKSVVINLENGEKTQFCSVLTALQYLELLSYLIFHLLVRQDNFTKSDLLRAKDLLENVPQKISENSMKVKKKKNQKKKKKIIFLIFFFF